MTKPEEVNKSEWQLSKGQLQLLDMLAERQTQETQSTVEALQRHHRVEAEQIFAELKLELGVPDTARYDPQQKKFVLLPSVPVS